MKKWLIIILVIILALAAIIYFQRSGTSRMTFTNSASKTLTNAARPMTISSPAFAQGQAIPKKYSCDGDGVNPPLDIKDVPPESKDLVLVVDDPDAPNGTWTHWIMWNIPVSALAIAENSVPQGAVQGQASSGQNSYGGPCPPSGTHRYYFKLFALDAKLTIPSFSDVLALTTAINGHISASAELMGTYSKNNNN